MEELSADRLRGSLRGCLDIMGLPVDVKKVKCQ